jgi:hypothetical protein
MGAGRHKRAIFRFRFIPSDFLESQRPVTQSPDGGMKRGKAPSDFYLKPGSRSIVGR